MLKPLRHKIDCVVRVVTPENIEFEYMVAGPFQRLPAFLVDLSLRMAVFFLVSFLMTLGGIRFGAAGMAIVVTVGTLLFFVLSWLYGTVMESQFNGRTVGKMAFRLRVISADGRPINGTQAALRNLLRLCDFMPPLTLTLFIPDAPAVDVIPTCLIALISMTMTERMQRVGDLAAGTMVVWEGRRDFHTNLQPEDPRSYALSELIPPTFQISRSLARAVALYMERRTLLSPPRREEIASNLAKPLLQLFELRPDTSSDLLLCAIYVRIYQSEDQRLSKIQAARRQGQVINDQSARLNPPMTRGPATVGPVTVDPAQAIPVHAVPNPAFRNPTQPLPTQPLPTQPIQVSPVAIPTAVVPSVTPMRLPTAVDELAEIVEPEIILEAEVLPAIQPPPAPRRPDQ